MSSRTLHPHLLLGRIPSGPHRLPLHARTFYCTRLVRNDQPVTERPDANAFEKTLILPKTNFPFYNEVFTTDARLQERTSGELYRWQEKNAKGPLFVLHDGPPYANGDLHIGHALNKILKDIINRYNVSLGRRVHYVPGWDCHGLPIENQALSEINQTAKSVSPSIIRDAARATAVREVASQKEQFKQFGIMADWDSDKGTYRTLDHPYEMRQLRVFQKMVERGLIYRHYRPVHYSPSSRSALAEAELFYKDDRTTLSAHVKFKMATAPNGMLKEMLESGRNVSMLVWTTAPWTLTANMGIAVHPEITYILTEAPSSGSLRIFAKDRLADLKLIIGEKLEVLCEMPGSELVGASYKPIFSEIHPQSSDFPVISASFVTSDVGTGLVHCAPAHGHEDYHAFKSLNLLSNEKESIICHVDNEGQFGRNVADIVGEDAAKELIGKEVLKEGSWGVINLLKDKTSAFFRKKRVTHRYPYDWKTGLPIIITATSQWFTDLDKIKDDALGALQKVAFFPPTSRNRLEAFIRSRSEWCLSRQRPWGVPIPALHHTPTDTDILTGETLSHILSVLEEKGVEHWWNGPVEDFLPPSLLSDPIYALNGASVSEVWKKGTDTMDVWFDSGTSWSTLTELNLLDGENGQKGVEREALADVCLEGSDQHRGWFQSQLLTAIGAGAGGEVKSPFGTLVTHGMVLDQKGKKMSKSVGNVVSPLTIVNGGVDMNSEPKYGADLLRLWVATSEYWKDTKMGPSVISQTVSAMKKIRNSVRFMLGNINSTVGHVPVEKEEMKLAERYVMHELYHLEQLALEAYKTYNFPKLMSALNNFAGNTLSSLYFDFSKDYLYANKMDSLERRAVVTVLKHTLQTMPSIFAPVLPHLAEEIHSIRNPDTELSFFATPWKPMDAKWDDPQAVQEMEILLKVRGAVLPLLEEARRKRHRVIRSSLEAEVVIVYPKARSESSWVRLLHREHAFLKTLFIVSDVILTGDETILAREPYDWIYSNTAGGLVKVPYMDGVPLGVYVWGARREKCPRCWAFTREKGETLCGRCTKVVGL